jgi:hypothetical protein
VHLSLCVLSLCCVSSLIFACATDTSVAPFSVASLSAVGGSIVLTGGQSVTFSVLAVNDNAAASVTDLDPTVPTTVSGDWRLSGGSLTLLSNLTITPGAALSFQAFAAAGSVLNLGGYTVVVQDVASPPTTTLGLGSAGAAMMDVTVDASNPLPFGGAQPNGQLVLGSVFLNTSLFEASQFYQISTALLVFASRREM